MKKVTMFFCDIMGTLEGNGINQEIDYQKFNSLLQELRKIDGSDLVLFSLVSTDTKDIIEKEKKILERYFDKTILFGKQFFDTGYVDGVETVVQGNLGKLAQIINYYNELNEQYKVQKVYYADDTKLFHIMVSAFAEMHDWLEKLVSITPNQGIGVTELNELLGNQILEYKNGLSKGQK